MLEIAYMAGIIDGEGCIGFRLEKRKDRVNSYQRVILTICMTHFDLLTKIQEQFGGYLGPRRDPRPNNKQQWGWIVSHQKATDILLQCYPYLIVKVEQAKLAIAFQRLGMTHDPEINLLFKNKMHELNKKGRPIMEEIKEVFEGAG